MNNNENIYDVEDEFNPPGGGDKVLCIDDSPDFGPFGRFTNHLEKGLIYTILDVNQYNIRGEVVRVVGQPDNVCGYEKRHFKLVNRI